MEIRKDFESAAPFFHRLWSIGEEFAALNNDSWPHMKHREDFKLVYTMEEARRRYFEDIYADGRDMAIFMPSHLREFNFVGDYPSLTSYVESFKRNWCAKVDSFKTRFAKMQAFIEDGDTPWAVRQMIQFWERQIRLLEAVNATVEILKQTDIYRVENGEIHLTDIDKPHINIGVIGNVTDSKVNVATVDQSSSSNVEITYHQVFKDLRHAVHAAQIDATAKQNLIQHVDLLEAEVQKPGFTKRYQEFIAAGANHMTLLAPFLPALTALIGG